MNITKELGYELNAQAMILDFWVWQWNTRFDDNTFDVVVSYQVLTVRSNRGQHGTSSP
jgi:hypothetical protein